MSEFKRILIKSAEGVATVPASASHQNGDWLDTDIYEGEWYMDELTGRVYNRYGNTIKEYGGGVREHSITLSAAEILTGFSVPINAGVDTPGSGEFIEVLSGTVAYTYGTVAFDAANPLVYLITNGSSNNQLFTGQAYNGTSNKITRFAVATNNSNQIIVNQPLMIQLGNDSTVGDGTMTIYFTYRVVTL